MSENGTKTRLGLQIKSLEIDMAVAQEKIKKLEENTCKIERSVNKMVVAIEGIKVIIDSMNDRFDDICISFKEHVDTSTGFRNRVCSLENHRLMQWFFIGGIIASIFGLAFFKMRGSI